MAALGGRQPVALHLPGYSLYTEPLAAASRRAVELARASEALVSVDLASRQPILDLGPDEARSRIAAIAPDLLFGNVAEVEAILDGRDRAVLLDLAPVVVVKDGARGATILHRDGAIEVPTSAIVAGDTTGAGDAFAAGFLVRWLAGRPDARHRVAALTAAARSGHRAAGSVAPCARVAAIAGAEAVERLWSMPRGSRDLSPCRARAAAIARTTRASGDGGPCAGRVDR